MSSKKYDLSATSVPGFTPTPQTPRAEFSPNITNANHIGRNSEVWKDATADMTYADAMAALGAGTLTRSVLTENGWVCP